MTTPNICPPTDIDTMVVGSFYGMRQRVLIAHHCPRLMDVRRLDRHDLVVGLEDPPLCDVADTAPSRVLAQAGRESGAQADADVLGQRPAGRAACGGREACWLRLDLTDVEGAAGKGDHDCQRGQSDRSVSGHRAIPRRRSRTPGLAVSATCLAGSR